MANSTEQGDADDIAIRVQFYDPAISVRFFRSSKSPAAIRDLLIFSAAAHLHKQVNEPLNLEPKIKIVSDPSLPVVLDPSYPLETKYCDLPANTRALTAYIPANMNIPALMRAPLTTIKENVDSSYKIGKDGPLPSTSKLQAVSTEASSASARIDEILTMVASLKGEVSELKVANKNLQEQHAVLEQANESLEKRHTALEQESDRQKEECTQLRQEIVLLQQVTTPLRKRFLLDEAQKKIIGLVPNANSWQSLRAQYPNSGQLFEQLHPGDIAPLTRADIDFLCDVPNKVRQEGNKAAHTALKKDVLKVVEQEITDSKRRLLERLCVFVYGNLELY